MTVLPNNFRLLAPAWLIAFAGASGLGDLPKLVAEGGVRQRRWLEVGDGPLERRAAFVGERRLAQAIEQSGGIATPAQLRQQGDQPIELGAPAFVGLAITFDEVA